MGKIRIVITDDSSLARALLRSICEEQADIEVVGEAANGQQALALVQALQPDLVTMDLEMPVMNGMQAIEEIMHTKGVPILVVSSVADAQNALEAIGRGALEVIAKPDYSTEQAAEFIAKVRMLAGVSVITRFRLRKAPVPLATALPATPCPVNIQPLAPALQPASPPPALSPSISAAPVFVIASSTGGPQALAHILAALPVDFPSPIVIAQHISDGFAQGMADWLDALCPLPVRLAQSGMTVAPGVVYVAPSEQHLSLLGSGQLLLLPRGETDLYRPSCDRLLQSAASAFGQRVIGLILTGMGHDGAVGMAAIRAAGGATWAQDAESSVIFGMNQVAIERGAVQRVLALTDIANAMVHAARCPGGCPYTPDMATQPHVPTEGQP